MLRVRVGMLIIALFQILFWMARLAFQHHVDLHTPLRLLIIVNALGFVAFSFSAAAFRSKRTFAILAGCSALLAQAALTAMSTASLDFTVTMMILVFAVCSIAADRIELAAMSGTAVLASIGVVVVQGARNDQLTPFFSLLLLLAAAACGAIVSWFRVRSQELLEIQITQRELAEAELRATQAHLESILHATSDGLLGVRYTEAGPRISFANRRFGEIFGLDPAAVVGQYDRDVRAEAGRSFRSAQDFDRDVRWLYDNPDAVQVTELDLVYPRVAVLERWTGPISDRYGTTVGRIWAFRDVTTQRAMAREREGYATRLETTNVELARASRAKDSFLANLSHELRTPLSVIIGYQNLVLEGGLSDQEATEFLQRSTVSATHLLRLIQDMLDLTRLEAGTAEVDIETLPVAPLVAEVRDLTEVLASAKGLALHVAADPAAAVLADRQRLKQVLLNLVGNALKFTATGAIWIGAEGENGQVRFSVRDTGRGIPREQQALLFQKFMRLDTNITSPEDGVGLGLSICRELVTLMGGEIELSSEGVGKGTEVRFVLPRAV